MKINWFKNSYTGCRILNFVWGDRICQWEGDCDLPSSPAYEGDTLEYERFMVGFVFPRSEKREWKPRMYRTKYDGVYTSHIHLWFFNIYYGWDHEWVGEHRPEAFEKAVRLANKQGVQRVDLIAVEKSQKLMKKVQEFANMSAMGTEVICAGCGKLYTKGIYREQFCCTTCSQTYDDCLRTNKVVEYNQNEWPPELLLML